MKNEWRLVYTVFAYNYKRLLGVVAVARTRKHNDSIFIKLLAIAFSIHMVITLGSVCARLGERRQVLKELQDEYDRKLYETAQLKQLLEDGSTSELVVRAARERLGYVYSDEEVYIDISGN